MRLINTTTLRLEDFSLRQVPPYAILSHTWGDYEVTFLDMMALAPVRLLKRGYSKITQTCRLAKDRGLEYAWIDTCCIDKSSSAELTESINSMFGYYERADICFAHLVDVPAGSSDIAQSRWFTRGWTLQELLAPGLLWFLDQTWTLIGEKIDLVEAITRTTDIPARALKEPWEPGSYSISRKMSWASNRYTTRVEDVAYCLLGIFAVNMPLIYGEGRNAFRRLQEEIIKQDNDLTILAWNSPRLDSFASDLMASSPSCFLSGRSLAPFSNDVLRLSVTNSGLLVTADVPLLIFRVGNEILEKQVGIYIGYNEEPERESELRGGLFLRKLGPGLFCRHGRLPLAGFNIPVILTGAMINKSNFYIMMGSAERMQSVYEAYRRHTIHIPHQPGFELTRVVPESLWDPSERTFLRPFTHGNFFYPMVLAMSFQAMDVDDASPLLILCDNRTGSPRAGIVSSESVNIVARLLFRGSHRENSRSWTEFEERGVGIHWYASRDPARDRRGHQIRLTAIAPGKEEANVNVSLHINEVRMNST